MSPPSDSDVRQALKHPLRRRLMPIFFANRPLSPREASRLVGKPLSNVSYHIGVLVKYQFLVLHSKEPVRGTEKSYYVPNEEVIDLPLVKNLLEDPPHL